MVEAAGRRTRSMCVSVVLGALVGCSDDGTNKTTDPGAGGSGGQLGSGGAPAAGGSATAGSGGQLSSGGAPAAGGSATGGQSNSGGAPAAGGGDAGCGTESFSAIYSEIFADAANSCVSAPCHGRTMRLEDVGNLDMGTPEIAYASLVGKTSDSKMCAGKLLVDPGNAAGSLLVAKLRDETVECGTSMPAGSPIDDAALMRIVDWINAGACDN